jgi:molybdenum cofactor biosynthesis enzyme MoaA
MPYVGFLDRNDGWTAFGWAFDSERPDQPVEVEFILGDQHVGTRKADEFRADLQQKGFGNGRHGFRFRFPMEANGADTLTARIKSTEFVLRGSPMARKQRETIAQVAGDIVNQCNLRCPFCIVDYTNVKKLSLMTPETFARAIELLPMTSPGSFWLSCLHEPTLHPQFIDFIEFVPDAYRDRISFTTNLSKRLSDDFLERLANSGVHNIRVSFDSRRPEVFAELRKKGRYQVFDHNLKRLSVALKASRRRPLLHFITMALKENCHEIADIVRFGRELGGDSHEVRYIYYGPHLARWGKNHILDANEWAALERSLAPLASPTLSLCGPYQVTRELFEEEHGLSDYIPPENHFGGKEDPRTLTVPEPAAIGRYLPDEALRLSLRWDGVMVGQNAPEEVFRVNINKIEYPARYFESLRVAAAGSDELGRG